MVRKDIASNLKKLVLALFLEFALTILSGFSDYFTGTAQIVFAISALVLCIVCIVLYLISLGNLKNLNGNFKFAFLWIFITFVLYIAQSVCSSIGQNDENSIFQKISQYISVVVSISDVVFVVAIVDGTKCLLKERGFENLAKFGSKIEVGFILSLFAGTIIRLVLIILSGITTVAVIVATILMIVFLLLYIIAYICLLPYLIRSARKLGR